MEYEDPFGDMERATSKEKAVTATDLNKHMLGFEELVRGIMCHQDASLEKVHQSLQALITSSASRFSPQGHKKHDRLPHAGHTGIGHTGVPQSFRRHSFNGIASEGPVVLGVLSDDTHSDRTTSKELPGQLHDNPYGESGKSASPRSSLSPPGEHAASPRGSLSQIVATGSLEGKAGLRSTTSGGYACGPSKDLAKQIEAASDTGPVSSSSIISTGMPGSLDWEKKSPSFLPTMGHVGSSPTSNSVPGGNRKLFTESKQGEKPKTKRASISASADKALLSVQPNIDETGAPYTSEKSEVSTFAGATRSLGMQRFSVHEKAKKARTNRRGSVDVDIFDSEGRPVLRVGAIDRFIHTKAFDICCAVLLLTNSVFIGVQVEHSATSPDGKVPSFYIFADGVYAILFMAELVLRIAGLGVTRFFSGEDRHWNWFDMIVVCTGFVEAVISSIMTDAAMDELSNLSALRTIRIARVARVIRVVRLMRFFRSLRILVNAIFSTVKSCVWTSLLLCIILYIFGVLFAQATSDHLHNTGGDILAVRSETEILRRYFGTLPRSIFTLLKSILGGIDWEPVAQALSDLGTYYVAVFIWMIVFVYLAVMNVISGLFLQSAIEHAHADIAEQIHRAEVEKKKYQVMFQNMFAAIDKDDDGSLSLAEFEKCIGSHSMQGLFRAMDINANDAWTLFKLLDVDGEGILSTTNFVDGCWNLKGNAKSMHMAQVRYELEWLMDAMMELANFVEVSFADVQEYRGSLAQESGASYTEAPRGSVAPESSMSSISTLSGYSLVTHPPNASAAARSGHKGPIAPGLPEEPISPPESDLPQMSF